VSRALVLFTSDLRVHDQPALAAAIAEHEVIVPAFVLDDHLLTGSCGAPNRLAFLLESLRDLQLSIQRRGGALAIRRGDVVEQALALARRWKASALYMSESPTPYGTSRHTRLAEACAQERIELRTSRGPTVIPPGAITPSGGDHYRVFTPYWRVWREQPIAPSRATPRTIPVPSGLKSSRIPSLATLTDETPSANLRPGGETEGRKQLARWLGGGLAHYAQRHDDLVAEDTSHLSAHLHFGCLSARELLERCDGRDGAEDFVRQLCWRDFHHQVLAARPDLPRADYHPRGDRWHRGRRSIEAWKQGRTGYPIVDAGMRQLASEGFMHNRSRMIVASFLTKLLHVDWRVGAAHFASFLADADVANNVGNWQWVAGTGNDTRPNRVLNPLRQAQRFDRHGDYVRRHLPELSTLFGNVVHEPWKLAPAERRTLDYPDRIVDHVAATEEFRRRRGA
jgi:deoxyribodipyrimidine photo-lyase